MPSDFIIGDPARRIVNDTPIGTVISTLLAINTVSGSFWDNPLTQACEWPDPPHGPPEDPVGRSDDRRRRGQPKAGQRFDVFCQHTCPKDPKTRGSTEIRTVRLSRPEQQAYDAFEEDLVLRFGDQMVLGTTALVETMKLRQLTSGFAYAEDGEVIQVGTAKLTELCSLLDEISPHQVIIWANFRAEIQQLLQALPGALALWSGTEDREQVIEAFKAGQAQYLIANPQSAGHGLTFVNCHYAVYFGLSYSYELQKQSEDRIHRIGQQVPCEYFYLLAERTVDETIYRTVRKKGDLSSATLAYLRKRHHDQTEPTA